jgi:hypothetical protein
MVLLFLMVFLLQVDPYIKSDEGKGKYGPGPEEAWALLKKGEGGTQTQEAEGAEEKYW